MGDLLTRKSHLFHDWYDSGRPAPLSLLKTFHMAIPFANRQTRVLVRVSV